MSTYGEHRRTRAVLQLRGWLVTRAAPAAVVAVVLAAAIGAGCGGGSSARRPNLPSGSTQAEASSSVDFNMAGGGASPGGKADDSGFATWYGGKFAGKKTSNGERFDPRAMTAAHRSLPFGTWVEVRRVDTGRSVRVRINDRGPWGNQFKIIDLSRAAADALDMVDVGTTRVELRVVRGP